MTTTTAPQCDILLFFATSSEHDGLFRAASELNLDYPKKTLKVGGYADLGYVGTDHVVAVRTEMGPFAFGGSASRSLFYLAKTQATAVIGIGTAFGVDERKQKPLDILVSTGVLPYDDKRVTDRWYAFSRAHYDKIKRAPAKPSLVDLFKQARAGWDGGGEVHIGLFLSGGARIHSRSYRNELVSGCRNGHEDRIVGGDMEGVGFLAGCERGAPNWILVKAISDFADRNRDEIIEQTREPAAHRSAKFVLKALKDRGAKYA